MDSFSAPPSQPPTASPMTYETNRPKTSGESRPLTTEWPEQTTALNTKSTYMIGNAMAVVPVVLL